MGRINGFGQCALGGCAASTPVYFVNHFTYDCLGDVLTGLSTIAGGGVMTPTYNAIGQITQLATNCIAYSGWSCVAGNVASTITYNALGQPVSDTLGTSSGLNEVWTYDVNGEHAGYAAGNIYNYSLTYGMPTIITSSTDAENVNWSYTYDSYNRLTCAWVGSACNSSGLPALGFTYDQYGNRWQQNLMGAMDSRASLRSTPRIRFLALVTHTMGLGTCLMTRSTPTNMMQKEDSSPWTVGQVVVAVFPY
jgi:hypothetical protein